ncbi:hypothetical protein CMI37_19660 [Candidatus Pacearchaeota archaeon]|nr:hypothetical protein [Candidatus Pacearchaeota archaeon]
MSLNFPTTFWKTDTPAVVDDFTITWTTSLAQSYGDNGSTAPSEFSFPVGNSYDLANHNYPFEIADINGWGEDFYTTYEDDTWQGDPASESSTPYFGWYRNGGTDSEGNIYDLFPDFHRSDPWIVNGFDRPNELHIFFEADLATAEFDGWESSTSENIPHGIFNNFIQTGQATGTFNISSSQAGKDLVIKVSGLGEDLDYLQGAQNYDTMTLCLDRPGVASDDFICSGCAPLDGRNVMDLASNFDMQQVKLYTGGYIYSAANADPSNETSQDTSVSPVRWTQFGIGGDANEHRNGSERKTPSFGSTWGDYLVSGVPRANPSQRVDQDTRNNYGAYVTSAGVGTFTATNLLEGEHKIKIDVSTVDGTWSSGAFYGFYFTLVD